MDGENRILRIPILWGLMRLINTTKTWDKYSETILANIKDGLWISFIWKETFLPVEIV